MSVTTRPGAEGVPRWSSLHGIRSLRQDKTVGGGEVPSLGCVSYGSWRKGKRNKPARIAVRSRLHSLGLVYLTHVSLDQDWIKYRAPNQSVEGISRLSSFGSVSLSGLHAGGEEVMPVAEEPEFCWFWRGCGCCHCVAWCEGRSLRGEERSKRREVVHLCTSKVDDVVLE